MENCNIIMDDKAISRAITRISFEIIEKFKGTEDIVILGILKKGGILADRIAEKMSDIEKMEVLKAYIDVTNYRDDIEEKNKIEKTFSTNINVQNKIIVLVDDVLYTGRTVRAAIDAIMDTGRPKVIALAALIDRGHRELPIRPDFVGKNLPTSRQEKVKVNFYEFDGKENVEIIKR